ncbi:MAG: hypothetical protein Q4F67_09995, partial [Propionibacteriaceae bacterium]|nr:hypothetical protein [Propionibacteriaceae bacterium]
MTNMRSAGWGRRRAYAGFVLVLLMTMVLSACGVNRDPDDAIPDRWVDRPTVSANARKHFTDEQITSAFASITQFAFERGYDPALMDPQKKTFTAQELNAGVEGQVTAALWDRWTARVAAALGGSAEDQDALRVLQFYDWEQPEWRLPANGSPVQSQWIRNGEIGATEATEDSPLWMKVTIVHEADLRYQEAGAGFDLNIAKRVSYWLVPAGDGPGWFIDAYEGVFAVGEALPVEDSAQTSLPTPTTTPGENEWPEEIGADPGEPELTDPPAAPRRDIDPGPGDPVERLGNTAPDSADAPPVGQPVTRASEPAPRPGAPAPAAPGQAAPPA